MVLPNCLSQHLSPDSSHLASHPHPIQPVLTAVLSPNYILNSFTSLTHLCHHPVLGHTLPGLTIVLATLLVLLPLNHSTSNSTKYCKTINQILQFLYFILQHLRSLSLGPQSLQGLSSQALHLTAHLPTYAVVCFSLFKPARHLPASGPGHSYL